MFQCSVPHAGPIERRRRLGRARRPTGRRGLGLIELLTIVALLIVGLALVVATARHVRSNSANELTRKRLQALVDETSRLIVRDRLDPLLPLPAALAGGGPSEGDEGGGANGQGGSTTGATAPLAGLEATLQQFARDSSDRLAQLRDRERAQAVAAAAGEDGTERAAGSDGPAAIGVALLAGGSSELRDAWGRPIALMARQVPSVGIAPDDGPFFVSAGPDGQFLTLSDNLYSYDLPALLPAVERRPSGTSAGAVRLRDRRDELATRPTARP